MDRTKTTSPSPRSPRPRRGRRCGWLAPPSSPRMRRKTRTSRTTRPTNRLKRPRSRPRRPRAIHPRSRTRRPRAMRPRSRPTNPRTSRPRSRTNRPRVPTPPTRRPTKHRKKRSTSPWKRSKTRFATALPVKRRPSGSPVSSTCSRPICGTTPTIWKSTTHKRVPIRTCSRRRRSHLPNWPRSTAWRRRNCRW